MAGEGEPYTALGGFETCLLFTAGRGGSYALNVLGRNFETSVAGGGGGGSTKAGAEGAGTGTGGLANADVRGSDPYVYACWDVEAAV